MKFSFRINSTDLSSYFKDDWFIFIILFASIVCLISLAFKIVSRWIYFKKCGEEGWKSLIPIYTDITFVKTSGINWWWMLFLYIPIIQSMISFAATQSDTTYLGFISLFFSLISLFSIFAKFNIGYNICKKFNTSYGYAVLIALLEPIGLLILGLSKNLTYNKDIEVEPNGVFKGSSVNNYKSNNMEYCEYCGSKINKNAIFCENCGKKVK